MMIFVEPETVLKRAEELIKKQDALQVLHDLITSSSRSKKKWHRAWQKTIEKVMFKHIELCVELRNGRYAKDGLIRYRNLCLQVNVTSLEDVIKHFMHLSTERAQKALNQAHAQAALEEAALDIDNDLEEAAKTPEDLMLLSYASGDKGKNRSNMEVVTPWLKFLWETYRTVLDILKNNSKLEAHYAMTARRAFKFCKQYECRTEFRRLCVTIRNHLLSLNKYRDQMDLPDLSTSESLQLYLNTRFEQLEIATELQLWQEAFQTAEDIHALMCMVKKTLKPSLMVVYYAKLTEIFRVSACYLYHAYAWFKLFSVQKSFSKNLTLNKDLELIASSAVLAALSIAPYDNPCEASSHLALDRNLRMANLIRFVINPQLESREVLSRSSLLTELVSNGIMNYVTQEVKDLYFLLEHEFLPLDLASKVRPLLIKISKLGGQISSASSGPEVHLSQYVPALENLATLRLIQHVSHVYQTMKIESLSNMIPFFDFSTVEKISVDAVKHNFIAMKVDHMKGVVAFGNLGLESDVMHDDLVILTESLSEASAMIYPPAERTSKLGKMLPGLAEILEKDHKRLLARKSVIEKRKGEQERQLLEMEQEDESKRVKLLKITEEAEGRRLASEYAQREKQRILREIEEREQNEAQALLQEAEKHRKKKGKKPLIPGEKVTKQSLMQLALSEQLQERQAMKRKLHKLGKSLDYLERAKREEAAPLIEAAFHRRLVEAKVLHEREQQQEINLSRQHHDADLMEKTRLARMLDNMTQFKERVMSRREAEYNRLRAEREERTKEYKRKIFCLRTEVERLRKLREVEEARKHEEVERKRKEEAERRAKLDKVAEMQRQRERELEEKETRRIALLGRSNRGPRFRH